MRTKIVAGNWKMNMNFSEGIEFAKKLEEYLENKQPNCRVIIFPPYIHTASLSSSINQKILGIGAQNCSNKEKGAYTGEVSAEMLSSANINYVLIGHSERRAYYHENDLMLAEKVQLALHNNITPIFCVGENLSEREDNKQFEVVEKQLSTALFNLSEEDFSKIILAYEPVWAIGTGKTATPSQAQEIHAHIRSIIANKYGNTIAQNCSILYGGSCNAENAATLFSQPDVDGGLIGGASLELAKFTPIIEKF